VAWCAGFIVVTAPAGIGVRELVLVVTLSLVLPKYVTDSFKTTGERTAFLAFLGGLLRLWTIVGELIVAAIAYTADYEGALGRSPHQRMHKKTNQRDEGSGTSMRVGAGDVAG